MRGESKGGRGRGGSRRKEGGERMKLQIRSERSRQGRQRWERRGGEEEERRRRGGGERRRGAGVGSRGQKLAGNGTYGSSILLVRVSTVRAWSA
eukprot:763085-Hanusia_phi.AAC.2